MSENLTIEEIRAEKREVARKIFEIVADFQKRTNVPIKNIDLNYIDVTSFRGDTSETLANVGIKLESL
jgi:hypothetical protein